MNPAYAAARIMQIDRMIHRLTEAKEEESQHHLINPLSRRSLGESAALFALKRRNQIRNDIERLTDERKELEGISG